MRILVISNFYPPFHKSGYELACQDIVESLKTRHHQIVVLTSTYGIEGIHTDNNIHRELRTTYKESLDWNDIFLKELTNQTVFKKQCLDFEPEIAFFFDLSQISFSLTSLAEEMGLPTCTYYLNKWFITQENDHWYQLWPEGEHGFKILRFLTHRFSLLPPRKPPRVTFSVFANSYLKNMAVQLNKSMPDAAVIPSGIDINQFPFKETLNPKKQSRLLYVGKIQPDQGIDDVIEALHLLEHKDGNNALSLTIAGDEKSSPDYVEYLRGLADSLGVLKKLRFSGIIPLEEMPNLYHSHDILISPSYLEESSNRTLLEAMSSGTAIVSVSTDNNSEILDDEINALIFPKENPISCAEKIQRLLENHRFLESLRTNARSTIEKKFKLEQSINALEQILIKATKKAKSDDRPKKAESIPSPGKNHLDISLNNIVRRAKRWLTLGNFVVFVRNVMRLKFLMHIPLKIYKKTIFITPHSLHAIIFNIYYLLKGQHRKKSEFHPHQMQKILVVQLADIGDVILTSPFLRELRRYFPKAWIGLAVQPRMFNLIEKCPYVDDVIPFDWGASKNWDAYLRGSPRWWIQSSRTAKHDLWKYHLDLAISTRWNEDPCQAASLILMYTSGAVHRIAYKATSSDPMRYGWKDLNRLITRGPVRGAPKHEVEHQLDILRFLGENPKDTRLEVWTTKEDDLFAQGILDKNDIPHTEVLIAFAPGAAWPYRRWPSNRFIELGNWLQETYKVYILILAAKGEHDLALQIEGGLRKGQTLNLAGKTTLREMASILKHCKLFIGNDSGPLHIATAAGIPVVGFYGPGEYRRFKPWGRNHDVLRLGLSCSPCSQNCIFSEPRCIKGISVSQAKKILARKLASILDLS